MRPVSAGARFLFRPARGCCGGGSWEPRDTDPEALGGACDFDPSELGAHCWDCQVGELELNVTVTTEGEELQKMDPRGG